MNTLKYVRPGGGFEPNFELTEKVDVNGENEHPIYTYLKVIKMDIFVYNFDDNIITMFKRTNLGVAFRASNCFQ